MYVAENSNSCALGISKFQLQSLGRWKHQIQRGSGLNTAKWYSPDWAKHTLNYEQLQNHMADKRATFVLKFYCPLKWFFWQSPECLCFAGLSIPHDLFRSESKPTQCLNVHGHCYLHQPLNWALSWQLFFWLYWKICRSNLNYYGDFNRLLLFPSLN